MNHGVLIHGPSDASSSACIVVSSAYVSGVLIFEDVYRDAREAAARRAENARRSRRPSPLSAARLTTRPASAGMEHRDPVRRVLLP